MHCGGCSTGIQMLVSSTDGVKSAFVDLDTKKGTFEIDPDKVTKEQIVKSIESLGYKAS